jgi:type I restriction enzyme S subunit
MAKQGTKTATPRLRFPEFHQDEPWTIRLLGSEATFEKGRGVSKAEVGPSGRHQCIRYGELYTRYGEVIREVISLTSAADSSLFFSRFNDVIVPASGETKEDIATASCVLLDGVALGGDLNVIRSPHNGVFLSYLLNGSKRRELAKVAQGDTVVHLYPRQLAALSVAFPEADEQQKIADCLTSLDEVIAAQGRKVEALKTHKRGLMQQLFPRQGETRPRLRFPEFSKASEWRDEPVSALIRTVAPPQKIATSGYQQNGCLAIVDQSPDPVCGWTDDLSAKVTASLPLIVFGDHTCVLKLIEHDFAQGADGIKIISAKSCVDVRFLFYALQADPIVSTSYRRHFALLQEKLVRFPEDANEQQRIADCLASLDTRITAETSRLAALKSHKQGLMQQLFPTPEARGA